MADTYQAVYDAVRSRISNGDIGSAIERCIYGMNLSHYADMAYQAAQQAAAETTRPSVLYRPTIFKDGADWCALYGDDLQNGVAGFGKSPADAMYAFDNAWWDKTPSKIAAEEKQQERTSNSQFGVGA